jgi:transcriptional regulator of NAD metabolism
MRESCKSAPSLAKPQSSNGHWRAVIVEDICLIGAPGARVIGCEQQHANAAAFGEID